ncbi:MAG: hypothetical protein EOO73_36440 [Myxococcales bacterium]|nr:MAG: hypothetical protein EOO73_36440 [Myxococcales bacterium]
MGSSWLVWGALVGASFVALPAFAQVRAAPALESRRGGQLEVELHARTTQAMARAERAAWLTVSLPLERAAAPRLAEVPTPPAAAPLTSNGVAAVSFQQLRSLAAFTRQATAVALSVVRTAAERGRLDSLAARARSSALLPELRFRVLRNSDKALRWIPSTDDPYRITQADGTGLVLEGSLSFRLDRLVFASEELAVERLRQDAGAARLKLEARVLEALLGLFRAREQACAEDGNGPDRPQRVLELVHLFAELDALTAGWFSEQASTLGRSVWGFPEAVLGACAPPPPPPPEAPAAIPAVSMGGAAIFAVASPAGSE